MPATANPAPQNLADDAAPITGAVHSWELVTAVDGPGTRMTIFLSGCPLRCLYCHNPDTRYAKWGTITPLGDLVDRMDRYIPIFNATGGGLTISGGEPMQQPKFFRALIAEAKKRDIHVTVDTTGFLGKMYDDETLSQIDLFLLDMKSGLEETHKKTTKRSLAPVVEFGERLARLNKDIWVRFVLVPGLTDAVDNVAAVAKQAASLGAAVKKVEILPFHQMGRDKWDKVGLEYELQDTQPPSPELIERVRQQFLEAGLNVTVG